MQKAKRKSTFDRQQDGPFLQLAVLLAALMTLPHWFFLEPWLVLVLLIESAVLGYFCLHRQRTLPASIKLLCLAVGVVLTFISAAGSPGPQSMITLLVVGFYLKLVELTSARDRRAFIYLGLLVAATQLLLLDSVFAVIYSLLGVLVLLWALLNTTHQAAEAQPAAYLSFGQAPVRGRGLGWRNAKLVLGVLLQALPIAAVLFMVFPRIAPLWQVSVNQSSATTGLSDVMSPGDISQLTRISDPAFRVSFDSEPPAQDQLYWKALTYSYFDGRQWHLGDEGAFVLVNAVPLAGDASRDGVIEARVVYYQLGAQSKPYFLPRLDVAMNPQGRSVLPDNTLGKLDQGISGDYDLVSALGAAEGYSEPTSAQSRQRLARYLASLTQLPEGNPRTQAWLREQLPAGASVDAIIELLSDTFANGFRYSLSPSQLGRAPIDSFMFDTQEGFCGHYASAAAVVFRMAGIPARVVGGYQGGEWNPYEGFLQVRQYDAHAWVEAWDEERQYWRRFDPTAVVMPSRLAASSDASFANDPAFLANDQLIKWGRNSPVLSELRLRWAAFNYGWQRWVVNYDKQQLAWLSGWLGGLSGLKLALLLLVPLAVTLVVVAWWLFTPPKRRATNPAVKWQTQCEALLAKHGFERRKRETFKQFCQRVSAHDDALGGWVLAIQQQVEWLHYAPPTVSAQERARMQTKVQQLISQLKKHLRQPR